MLDRQLRKMRTALRVQNGLSHTQADTALRNAVAALFAEIATECADGPQAEIARMVEALSAAVSRRRRPRPALASLRELTARTARRHFGNPGPVTPFGGDVA